MVTKTKAPTKKVINEIVGKQIKESIKPKVEKALDKVLKNTQTKMIKHVEKAKSLTIEQTADIFRKIPGVEVTVTKQTVKPKVVTPQKKVPEKKVVAPVSKINKLSTKELLDKMSNAISNI